ncbi:hypothetical protein BT93_G1591 [Corymbia citriodora subsp. variegata]|nr:hypothetical protein BT93_G1591 [Corymbia citriodora subsp. variegata]
MIKTDAVWLELQARKGCLKKTNTLFFSRTNPHSASPRISRPWTNPIPLRTGLRPAGLGRSRVPSKLWQSLISDLGFGKWHLERLKAGDHQKKKNLTWKPIIVGTCDGLVCFNVMDGRFILYNPTTEEFRKIPSSDLSLEGEFFRGFGCDPASDDYKVIVSEGSKICRVKIFSLKCGSWRKIQVQESRLPMSKEGKTRKRLIMSFDMSDEIFHQMLPVSEWNGDIIQGLDIQWDNLYTLNAYWFMAWIMHENGRGGSWKKLFSFLTEGLLSYYLQIPVAYTRKGKILFLVDFYGVILFNPMDNTCKNTPIVSTRLAIYVEALVSPYIGCEPSRI